MLVVTYFKVLLLLNPHAKIQKICEWAKKKAKNMRIFNIL